MLQPSYLAHLRERREGGGWKPGPACGIGPGCRWSSGIDPLTPAGVEHGQADDLIVLIADDHIVFRQFGVRGDGGLFEIRDF